MTIITQKRETILLFYLTTGLPIFGFPVCMPSTIKNHFWPQLKITYFIINGLILCDKFFFLNRLMTFRHIYNMNSNKFYSVCVSFSIFFPISCWLFWIKVFKWYQNWERNFFLFRKGPANISKYNLILFPNH